MSRTDRTARVVAASLSIVWGVVGLLGFLFVGHAAAKSTCFQEGPWSPDALVSEQPDTVTESLSLWPLGRSCSWLRADGDGRATTTSGDIASTSVIYGSVAIGIAGFVSLALLPRANRSPTSGLPPAGRPTRRTQKKRGNTPSPLSIYSAEGGLRQDPGHSAD